MLIRDFKRRHPDGVVLELFNGDFSGAGTYSFDDQGFATYEFLARLSADSNRFPLVNMGNHDGTDFLLIGGHESLLAHHQKILSEFRKYSPSGRPLFKLQSANLVPSPVLKDAYEPYRDIQLPGGKILRVISLTLDGLYQESHYKGPDSEYPIWLELSPMLESAKKILIEAAALNIKEVVFQCHEGSENVMRFTDALKEWMRNSPDPKMKNINIPVVFAAHDHQPQTSMHKGTLIQNSGMSFEFSTVELGDDGRLSDYEHYTLEEQRKIAGAFRNQTLSEVESKAVEFLHDVIRDKNAKLDAVMMPKMPLIAETRYDLTRGRTQLGSLLSDALIYAVQDDLPALRVQSKLVDELPLVSFHNSSSYRANEPIFGSGPYRFRDFLKQFPFERKFGIIITSGKEAQRLYLGAFERSNVFTTQISSNLQINESNRLLTLSVNGQFIPLEQVERVVLILESWVYLNGMGSNNVAEVLAQSEHLTPTDPDLRNVMKKYFLPFLPYSTQAACSQKLTPAINSGRKP